MNRPTCVFAIIFVAATTLAAQSASQSNPYEGTSNPPPDDTIVTTQPVQAKPPAGQPYQPPASASAQPVEPAQPEMTQPAAAEADVNPPAANADDQGDAGVVQVAPDSQQQLQTRQSAYASDPDGDIVHPQPLPPGSLGEGTTIRARLLEDLSSGSNDEGDEFRTRVASDVVQGGQVLIPAGSEIDGRVIHISTGHLGGHGSMRLQPDTVILPSGERFHLYADVSGTPGSNTRVTDEGTVIAGSRVKRDEVEYGGAVGAGAVAGAVVAGPVGALTGGIIGAGLVTAHLLVNHPQARLDSGTVLIFSLTEPLALVPSTTGGN